jgi:hypothetical protein
VKAALVHPGDAGVLSSALMTASNSATGNVGDVGHDLIVALETDKYSDLSAKSEILSRVVRHLNTERFQCLGWRTDGETCFLGLLLTCEDPLG